MIQVTWPHRLVCHTVSVNDNICIYIYIYILEQVLYSRESICFHPKGGVTFWWGKSSVGLWSFACH